MKKKLNYRDNKNVTQTFKDSLFTKMLLTENNNRGRLMVSH